MYVLDEGTGTWDGSIRNRQNPTRRDIQTIRAGGFAALQFEADNPGVWRKSFPYHPETTKHQLTSNPTAFHCHVAWHLSGGLAMNVVSRPDDIPPVPNVMPQTCVDWDWYSTHNVVDQIDAGS